ncbi:MAG TPA: iron transporter [Nitrosopumilaceae archaeon]|nr:iron transporter [Nitrosopumilaceae archaeon]
MTKICTKCKKEIPQEVELDPMATNYPCCSECWAEWKQYRVMVMNEMKLDMSMPDHRKVLKKYEKVFVGVLTPEGDVVNFADENKRNPEKPT